MSNAYKDILNTAAKKNSFLKELSQEESAALKRCLLDIYQRIASVCAENNLVQMLGGGSCLGAVRHQGFIPWDDDLDLLMPRKDYESFINLCEKGALGDNFFISYPNKNTDSGTMFLKVYMKGTLMKGLGTDGTLYPQECFVDIFPIEGMSNIKLVRKVRGFIANTIRLIANVVAESKQRSAIDDSFYHSTLALRVFVFLRRVLGKCCSVISHRKWVYWYDSFVRNVHSDELVGIPTGRKLYDGETFPPSVFLPVATGTFEGMTVFLPANVKAYLTNLYQNYMQIPPEDKRERHFFTDFFVPSKYFERD